MLRPLHKKCTMVIVICHGDMSRSTVPVGRGDPKFDRRGLSRVANQSI